MPKIEGASPSTVVTIAESYGSGLHWGHLTFSAIVGDWELRSDMGAGTSVDVPAGQTFDAMVRYSADAPKDLTARLKTGSTTGTAVWRFSPRGSGS